MWEQRLEERLKPGLGRPLEGPARSAPLASGRSLGKALFQSHMLAAGDTEVRPGGEAREEAVVGFQG